MGSNRVSQFEPLCAPSAPLNPCNPPASRPRCRRALTRVLAHVPRGTWACLRRAPDGHFVDNGRSDSWPGGLRAIPACHFFRGCGTQDLPEIAGVSREKHPCVPLCHCFPGWHTAWSPTPFFNPQARRGGPKALQLSWFHCAKPHDEAPCAEGKKETIFKLANIFVKGFRVERCTSLRGCFPFRVPCLRDVARRDLSFRTGVRDGR